MLMLFMLSMAVALLWAIGGLLQKYVLRTIGPKSLLVYSGVMYTVMIVVYWVIHKKEVHGEIGKLNTKIVVSMLAFVFLSNFLAFVIFNTLLVNHDVYKVTALTYVAPVFTVVLAAAVLGERPHPVAYLGVVLVFLGCLCVCVPT
jgi:drug/metabolite transporter (DMT)-like permease